MEYQKIINLLDNMSDQLSKPRAKNWVKLNYDRSSMYDKKNLKFQTAMRNIS